MVIYCQDQPGRGQLSNILTEANIKLRDVKLAAAIDVHESTYYRWLERGQKAEKLLELGQKIPEADVLFLQFLHSIRQSEAEGEVVINYTKQHI